MNAPAHFELLTEDQAADLLQVRPQTLSNWRCTGRVKLPYVRLGNKLIRYRRDQVDAFISNQTVHEA